MHKKLKKLCEKLRAKFPATAAGCSMLKIARLDDRKQAQWKVNHCSKKKEKSRKSKGEKNSKNQKALRRRSLSHPKTISEFGLLRMPDSHCTKTQCWWQERQAAVLQMHSQPD